MQEGSVFSDFLKLLRRSTDLLHDDPLREEIFSVERLETYAVYLATELRSHSKKSRGRSLVKQLRKNADELNIVYRKLASAAQAKKAISPAAEWFVDNFYIVEDQIRQIRLDLPPHYYRELPKLKGGELKDLPRVYTIALAFIAHTDSRIDSDTLRRFLLSFQSEIPLSIGELWAVAITLRIALVDHLLPLAQRIHNGRVQREEADKLCDRILALVASTGIEGSPERIVDLLSSSLNRPEAFDRAFIVQLLQRLRDQDPKLLPVMDWLNNQLATLGTSPNALIQLDHNRLAAAQVTVGNIITSMRLLSQMDWRQFVESVSLVDNVFAADPDGTYSKMDFLTRDRYRHVIERIARGSNASELEVAHQALTLAQAASQRPLESRETNHKLLVTHVGFYLIGAGLSSFERELKYKSNVSEKIVRTIKSKPTLIYLLALALLSTSILAPIALMLSESGTENVALIFFLILAAIPISELALSIINHVIMKLIPPKPLPRMETDHGIPDSAKTFIVIPTLLTHSVAIKELLETLHVHYLANESTNFYFALLTDFCDADSEVTSTDYALLAEVERGIAALNSQYPKKQGGSFYLFHRPRQWNEGEKKWMGFERKRGKLHEFNRMLRGATDTSYLKSFMSIAEGETQLGNPLLPSDVKYVITLDSDTILPRDEAKRLVGTILHPLNTPFYDSQRQRVTQGYAILQPRVSVSLPSASKTYFSLIFSGITGLDPYATAVSEVYQDLLDEGSYTGKGLYVIDAFEEALDGRIPPNTLLSHDLFESCYARSGLVTDIECFDDFPADYSVYLKRQHRWIRGDWQIALWLLPWVPNEEKKLVRNKLPLMSRWKIFDNLRRSLTPPAALLWLVLAWTVLPGSVLLWTALIGLVYICPLSTSISGIFSSLGAGRSWLLLLGRSFYELGLQIAQLAITLVFLPDQAWNQCDAIGRSLYRQIISKTKRLEWMTFSQSQMNAKSSTTYKNFLTPSHILSVFLTILIYKIKPNALHVAAPFLLAWFFSPIVRSFLRSPPAKRQATLTPTQTRQYRRYARYTWYFFETFMTKDDNWLPPDNFQEEPTPIIAHRTSPTNIGLALITTVSAYDFGYIGLTEMIQRLSNTLDATEALPKLNGHLFNWYDTSTLEPLYPRYISTVDSGNLAAHLLVVIESCVEHSHKPRIPQMWRDGMRDTIHMLNESVIKTYAKNFSTTPTQKIEMTQVLEDFVTKAIACTFIPETSRGKTSSKQTASQNFSADISQLKKAIAELSPIIDALEKCLFPLKLDPADGSKTIEHFLFTLKTQIASYELDLAAFATNTSDFQINLAHIAARCEALFSGMNFSFLLDVKRKVLSIGFNAEDSRLDNSFYDLLASEARLTCLIAIAKGDIPTESWFRLGRQMTAVRAGRALISWTGTMFEYLMPLLVSKRYANTILEETYFAVVDRQIEYGKEQHVPWGISEAGYYARDLQLNYQYGPFGVPGLGLKRGLSADLVVSPYSTMLAAMVAPKSALENLERLESLGAFSKYGFYESIDYTPERLQKKQKYFILRSHMAHHQGMSFVSISNLLNNGVIQNRFHTAPRIQATELLLQEKVPTTAPLAAPRSDEVAARKIARIAETPNLRTYREIDLPTPRLQILGNGQYTVMVTTSGSGFSRCNKLAISRWREDVTRDHWGSFIYIRNRSTSNIWSAGHAPLHTKPESYQVTYSEDKVEIRRIDWDTITTTEIVVAPEDNVELRRISLTNQSQVPYEYEVTSYMEAVFTSQNDDEAHPAFSNLFVQTEFLPAQNALIAKRRRRSNEEEQIFGFHVATVDGMSVGSSQYETDRLRFIGRGHTPADPQVIREDRPLSNSVGAVLDPILSLRQRVRIMPGETACVLFATGVASTREDAIILADKYHDTHIFAREAELAWTKARVQLRHLNTDSDKAHIFQRLAARILYADPSLRPRGGVIETNRRTQSSLWAYGISGDMPIVLTSISDEKDLSMVRDLLHAHEYLRLKGIKFDLVILNERPPSYLQQLQDELQRQMQASGEFELVDKPGGIFIRRTDIMPIEDVILLKSRARVYLIADKGSIEEQLTRRPHILKKSTRSITYEPVFRSIERDRVEHTMAVPLLEQARSLIYYNGIGGFSEDGREYKILLADKQWTPAPWINVIANDADFGFQVSESGSGFTWAVNSRENRLTPWSNDAISDPIGEVIYIRDEETGAFWTPTPLPIRGHETYVARHGQGYSIFEYKTRGISHVMTVFAAKKECIKITQLKLMNNSSRPRRLSVTSYVEWVLGVQRSSSSPSVVSWQDKLSSSDKTDKSSGILFATNYYNNEFAAQVAFTDMSGIEHRSYTCDRKSFIGRNGSLAEPKALKSKDLDQASGSALDPCGALRSFIDLNIGEEVTLTISLGSSPHVEGARTLALKYRDHKVVATALQEVKDGWEEILGAVVVSSPDAAMNISMNRWLLYQTIVCRLWARSAFYQSGGAYGFRDQLQDVMAVTTVRPDLSRQQILRAAARQFPEGDVQHWWHPPTGRGVRTSFSDDLLWLPYVVAHYIETTGDRSILDEEVLFIEAALLGHGEESSYTLPTVSNTNVSVLEHCLLTIDRSLKVGKHNLPLMGCGDWNDGMNRVGIHGAGESVWMGWFLYKTIKDFLPVMKEAQEPKRYQAYEAHLKILTDALDSNGWDGDWYRRAYFDNGEPLGSSQNSECRIDSIAQSWAVLSEAAPLGRARQAMAAVDEYLIDQSDGLIKLFAPPFDKSANDPGYIKGYLPGVRENGGQYTHAAIWTVMAIAKLGNGNRASELYALLNPINHTSTVAGLHKYKVEPYVIAADIYGMSPHLGRGGWTWYTGSASWMYRAGLESILGFQIIGGNKLRMKPCIPTHWNGYQIKYRFKSATYLIEVKNPFGVSISSEPIITIDGKKMSPPQMDIALLDDQKEHVIVFEMV